MKLFEISEKSLKEKIKNMPSCNISSNKLFSFIYIISIITFFIIGILYEINYLPRQNFEKKSNGLLGLIIIFAVAIGTVLLNYIQQRYNFSSSVKKFMWIFAHILCYFTATLLSPGQWPFWMAIGILWEFTEGYTICWPKRGIPVGFSGYTDIIANLAGISIAMWIRYCLAIQGQDMLPGLEIWNKN